MLVRRSGVPSVEPSSTKMASHSIPASATLIRSSVSATSGGKWDVSMSLTDASDR